jgi:glucose-6-phosphate isomerase
MSLININPTTTDTWKHLNNHFKKMQSVHMKSLFQNDPNRKENLSLKFETLSLDFSKNRITEETVNYLVGLAEECKLEDAIEKYFGGDIINVTEKRAVLHTALRNTDDKPIIVDGQDVVPEVNQTLDKIKAFSNKVISGEFKGY